LRIKVAELDAGSHIEVDGETAILLDRIARSDGNLDPGILRRFIDRADFAKFITDCDLSGNLEAIAILRVLEETEIEAVSDKLTNSSLPLVPEYDWEGARQRLVFYFSRRGRLYAEDLAQETLTRVVSWLKQEGNKIEGENSFQKVAYRFGHVVLLEDLRAQSHVTDELPQGLSAATNQPWGLDAQEATQLLTELLDRLPVRDRTLVLAAEQMSQAELAEQMGVPVSTLRNMLLRTRQELLRQLRITRGPSRSWDRSR
jgi:RNA polymerase sigma factor (sigma-70 family)